MDVVFEWDLTEVRSGVVGAFVYLADIIARNKMFSWWKTDGIADIYNDQAHLKLWGAMEQRSGAALCYG
jgi:hypothetical protein